MQDKNRNPPDGGAQGLRLDAWAGRRTLPPNIPGSQPVERYAIPLHPGLARRKRGYISGITVLKAGAPHPSSQHLPSSVETATCPPKAKARPPINRFEVVYHVSLAESC